jgi:hypothetical protein
LAFSKEDNAVVQSGERGFNASDIGVEMDERARNKEQRFCIDKLCNY